MATDRLSVRVPNDHRNQNYLVVGLLLASTSRTFFLMPCHLARPHLHASAFCTRDQPDPTDAKELCFGSRHLHTQLVLHVVAQRSGQMRRLTLQNRLLLSLLPQFVITTIAGTGFIDDRT